MPNRSSTKLPRAPKGVQFVAIEPEVWDLVMETLEYAQRITVAPPLMLSDTPVGKRISLGAVTATSTPVSLGHGQKPGMVFGVPTLNQTGFFFVFATEPI